MKTLYVHIGTTKTGTTAIQHFCVANRSVLEKKGFCYPEFPYQYIGKSQKRNGVFLTAAAEDEKARFAEAMGKIRELFQDYDNIVLSDEGIWFALKKRRKTLWEELKEAGERDGYGVKAIVYLRRQDDFAISCWNQRIKKRVNEQSDITQTWEEFIRNHKKYINLDYCATLEHAAGILGRENIIVRRYDRNYLKDGMVQVDFLDALGLEVTDEYVMDQPILNTRLSLNGCEIKRIINGLGEISLQESRFYEKVLRSIEEESNKEYPSVVWSASDDKAFMEQYDAENQKIVDLFIGDGQPLFQENYRDEEVWHRDNPHMQNDIIRFTVMSNIMLYRRIQELKEQNKEMRREMDGLRGFWSKAYRRFKSTFHVPEGKAAAVGKSEQRQ